MIYVFLADGFEEIEALSTVDILKRAELDVKTVSIEKNIVTGAHGISVLADSQIRDINKDDISCIVLPGGMPGTLNLEHSNELLDIVKYCNDNNLYIAAICAAPSILGHLKLLNSKVATCFPGFERELIGANYSSEAVCVHDNIITAKGPGVSIDFGLKIVELMCGKKLSNKIRVSMQCI